jgi:nucleoside-diphosphate-sugar epimerase
LTGEKSIKIEVLNIVRDSLGIIDKKTTLNQGKGLLITGANGFIGKGLLPQLSERGYAVYAPTRKEIDLLQDTVELDLLVKEKGISTILHLANPRIYTTNVSMGESLVMLKNVLDVCAENDIRLIYLSFGEVYSGYHAQELRADETLPHCPGNAYGQTKMLCESLIKCYQRQYGLSCLILRSSPVYGLESDRPKFIWNFLNKAKRDIEIITHVYKNGFPALDLLHINDLRQAIISAMDKDLNGSVNLGTGVGTTTAWIAEWIVQKTGSSSSIRHQKIDSFVGNIVMDNARSEYLLGWKPTISIKEGLQPIIESISRSGK